MFDTTYKLVFVKKSHLNVCKSMLHNHFLVKKVEKMGFGGLKTVFQAA